MGEDLRHLTQALAHARRARRIMLQNVGLSLGLIAVLIPLALRGVKYRPVEASKLLLHNLLVYGVGGLIVPFIGIKAIDLLLTAVGLA